MLLYKFKPATSLLYLLDILVHERLYCSPYEALNDPFEGQFRTLATSLGYSLEGPGQSEIGRILRNIDKKLKTHPRVLINRLDEIPNAGITRVCSLTGNARDVRMWSLYADSHQGVAVEIEFNDEEMTNVVRKVKYGTDLPKFAHSLENHPPAAEVLICKTNHWEYEDEYRIITDQETFPIAGKIRRVLLGGRCNSAVVELLDKLLPANIELRHTGLDFSGMAIQEDRAELRQNRPV